MILYTIVKDHLKQIYSIHVTACSLLDYCNIIPADNSSKLWSDNYSIHCRAVIKITIFLIYSNVKYGEITQKSI